MPLTRRQNGDDPTNIIQASWWNDFVDLLTGTMTDQAVNIKNMLTATALTITGKFSSDNGQFSSDGQGNVTLDNLICSGNVGVAAAGDVIDATTKESYYKSRGGGIHFQLGDGTDVVKIDNAGLHLKENNASTPSAIVVGVALGVKKKDGTQLMEARSNGNMVISGNQYQTSVPGVNLLPGQKFDGFDLAECYPADAFYEDGTLVCPHETLDLLTLCTHENCPYCAVVVSRSGLMLGAPDPATHIIGVSLVGRVNVKASMPIKKRDFVVSDGQGGVKSAEAGYVIGYALNDSVDGQVGVFLRPMYLQIGI